MPTAKAKATNAPQPDTAWDMIISILAGLYKAEAKAHAEFVALRDANTRNPFAPGLGIANDLLNSISTAKKNLQYDVHRMARSSGKAIPDMTNKDAE